MFNWSDLRIFLAVQRSGSLSAAARELHLNQTTVGRRLAELESAVGVQLFDRLPDGLRLTAAGREILAPAEAMEERAFTVHRTLAGRGLGVEGVVRLATLESFGTGFLAPRLSPLLEAHPGLRLELVTSNRRLDLSRREADLALRLSKPVESGLVARRLGALEYAVYGAPAYLQRHGRPDAASALSGHALLALDQSLASVPEAHWLDQQRGEAEPVLRSTSLLLLHQAAVAGMGLAVLPRWLAESAPGLELVLGREPILRRELWLAFHPDLRRVPRIRAVVEFVSELVAREAAKLRGMTA